MLFNSAWRRLAGVGQKKEGGLAALRRASTSYALAAILWNVELATS